MGVVVLPLAPGAYPWGVEVRDGMAHLTVDAGVAPLGAVRRSDPSVGLVALTVPCGWLVGLAAACRAGLASSGWEEGLPHGWGAEPAGPKHVTLVGRARAHWLEGAAPRIAGYTRSVEVEPYWLVGLAHVAEAEGRRVGTSGPVPPPPLPGPLDASPSDASPPVNGAPDAAGGARPAGALPAETGWPGYCGLGPCWQEDGHEGQCRPG